MKKSIVILATAMLLIVSALTFVAFRNPESGSEKKSGNTITGTWRLDSYKYGTTSN